MAKRKEPKYHPKKGDKRRSGPTFDPATGAASAGSPQKPASKAMTIADITAFLEQLEASRKSAPVTGMGTAPVLKEFRHRKPKYGGALKHGKQGILP